MDTLLLQNIAFCQIAGCRMLDKKRERGHRIHALLGDRQAPFWNMRRDDAPPLGASSSALIQKS
jgi:hypothetical protein